MRTLLFALAILAVTVSPWLASSSTEGKCLTPDSGGTVVSADAPVLLQNVVAAVRHR